MAEPKSVLQSLMSTNVVGEGKVDPHDARTWWAAYRKGQKGVMEVQAQMHDHTMYVAGVPARKFYYDPRVNALASAAVSAYYHLDAIAVAADVYNYEAEAMGAKMIYGDNAMPTIDFREPLVGKPADLDKLKAPADWSKAGRVPFWWETSRLIRQVTGNLGFTCAPLSLAVGVRSYPLLIRDMKRNPSFAHELFTRLVDDVLSPYLKAAADYLGGIDLAVGADAWAAYPDLTPEMVEEWVVPYAGRLMQNCMTRYGFAALPAASGDYCEEDLTKFDKHILWKCFDAQVKVMMGQPAIFMAMGRTQDYPLDATVEWLDQWKAKGVKASVTYAINARLLRDGPPERIVECVKNFIKAFGYDHNLTLFLANIPADAPSENVHAAVEAVHCYGQLPLAPDLDQVHFEMPKRETFQEYVAKMSDGLGLQF